MLLVKLALFQIRLFFNLLFVLFDGLTEYLRIFTTTSAIKHLYIDILIFNLICRASS